MSTEIDNLNPYILVPFFMAADPTPISGSLGLAMNACDTGTSGNFKSINLFTWGKSTAGKFARFYTSGPNISGMNTTLFLKVPEPADSGVSLYTSGPIVQSGSMDMFVYNYNPWSGANGSVTFYTNSTPSGTHGIQSSIPLFLDGLSQSAKMDLFVKQGDNTYTVTAGMDLFLESDLHSKTGTVDLYVSNFAYGSGVDLYVQGLSQAINPGPYTIEDGFHPAYGHMNLFIQRMPNAVLPFFLKNDFMGAGLPMYIDAIGYVGKPFTYLDGFTLTDGTYLLLDGSGYTALDMNIFGIGLMSSGVNLFTRGF